VADEVKKIPERAGRGKSLEKKRKTTVAKKGKVVENSGRLAVLNSPLSNHRQRQSGKDRGVVSGENSKEERKDINFVVAQSTSSRGSQSDGLMSVR